MDRKYYNNYENLEKTHWWHLARLEILKSICDDYIASENRILNLGVATGETSLMLNAYGEVLSLEYDKETHDFLKRKKGINAVLGSATDIPFDDNSFDCICCFDVLEHIENDDLAVQEIYRCLKPGGVAIITVPAYNFLWSNHDIEMHHFRRYNKFQLNKIFTKYGFLVLKLSYFNFFLFHPIFFYRLFLSKKKKNYEVFNDGFINKVLYQIFRFEKLLLRYTNFPYGVSILSILKK